MLAMAEAGLRVTEYTPSAVKMALTGFGAADKKQVQQVVAMRLKLETPPSPADAADALAIALCHVQGCEDATSRRRWPDDRTFAWTARPTSRATPCCSMWVASVTR